jgi:hypothetical protein
MAGGRTDPIILHDPRGTRNRGRPRRSDDSAGFRTLFIDPRCKQLIQDLERVHWKQDANGNTIHEMDKSDPARTHVSDALGYMIGREFGMHPLGG